MAAERLPALKAALQEHLRGSEAFMEVRQQLSKFVEQERAVGGRTPSRDKAIEYLQQKGLLSKLTKGALEEAALRVRDPCNDTAAVSNVADTHRHLLVQVGEGRAFTSLMTCTSAGAHVALSMQLLGQRHLSKAVPACAEPGFHTDFLVDLQQAAGAPACGPPAELRHLLGLGERLQICCVVIARDGRTSLLGRAAVEWRHVLQKERAAPAAVELTGVGQDQGVTLGVVHLRLTTLPTPTDADHVPGALVWDARRLEDGVRRDASARVLADAKAWWGQYTAMCPQHRHRLVKVLARGEDGEQRAVCEFVQPMSGGRHLHTPRQAARMVSLLQVQEDVTIGGANGQEAWCRTHTLLMRGGGAAEEHALLLCALLSGFGLEAYVCVGQDVHGNGAAWVVTRTSSTSVTVWDPLTALRYGRGLEMLPISLCPYARVGCLFNHHTIAANLQAVDTVEASVWALDDASRWHVLDLASHLPNLQLPLPCPLRPTHLNAAHQEEVMEAELRPALERARERDVVGPGGDGRMKWDDHLCHLLTPALAAYENQAVTGIAPGNEEFQHAIKRAVPSGHTFKAYPRQFNHLNADAIAKTLLMEVVPNEILSAVPSSSATDIRFGLRIKVFPYPEDLYSVWVMLAVRFKGIENIPIK